MPQPGWMVETVADARAIDMSGANAFRLRIYIVELEQDFNYDPGNGDTDNGVWIIEPDTGKGDGAWTPLGPVKSTTTPTGFTEKMTQVYRVLPSSTGDSVTALYVNPGNSSNWEQIT